VVIAVGLVFISRGLSNQLSALRAQEDYEALASLARQALIEIEALQTAPEMSVSVTPLRIGAFEAPYEHYEWEFSTSLMDANEVGEDADGPLATRVMVAVRRVDRPSPVVRLSAVWPREWIPTAW